jgi:hypothetical protein
LLEANRQAQQTLLAREDATASFARPSGRPHSSLIYGDHPMEERPKIVSWIQDGFSTVKPVGKGEHL